MINKKNYKTFVILITLTGKFLFSVKMNCQPNHSIYFNNFYVNLFRKPLVYITPYRDKRVRVPVTQINHFEVDSCVFL